MLIVLSNPVFGRNLQYMRKKYFMSKRSMARLLGISVKKLDEIESEKWPDIGIDLDSNAFLRLFKIFDVDRESFLSIDFSSSKS